MRQPGEKGSWMPRPRKRHKRKARHPDHMIRQFLITCLDTRLKELTAIARSAWQNDWPMDVHIAIEIPEEVLKAIQERAWRETEGAKLRALTPDERLEYFASRETPKPGEYDVCDRCRGEGVIRGAIDGVPEPVVPCAECEGTGLIKTPVAQDDEVDAAGATSDPSEPGDE